MWKQFYWPKRARETTSLWVVERTLGWLGRNKRLSKDYEETIESSEAWVYIAMTQLMLKWLRHI